MIIYSCCNFNLILFFILNIYMSSWLVFQASCIILSGKLSLNIPWSSIYVNPVVVNIQDVYVLVGPQAGMCIYIIISNILVTINYHGSFVWNLVLNGP